MRIDIRRWKSLIWLLNFLALVGVAYTFYDIVQKKNAGAYEARGRDHWRDYMVPRNDTRSQQADDLRPDRRFYDVIARLPVTGEAPVSIASDPAVSVEKPSSSVADIGEKIVVSLILYPDRAVLRYLDDPLNEYLGFLGEVCVQKGSSLAPPLDAPPYSARLVDIHPDAVTFSWGGEDKVVPVGSPEGVGEEAGTGTAPTVTQADRLRIWPHEEAPEKTVFLEADQAVVFSQEDQEYYADSYNDVLRKDVHVVSRKNRNSGKVELRLESVRSGGRAAQLGFRSNDVVLSINDQPVTTKSQAISYLKQHPNEPMYTVKFQRMGKIMKKTFIAPRRR